MRFVDWFFHNFPTFFPLGIWWEKTAKIAFPLGLIFPLGGKTSGSASRLDSQTIQRGFSHFPTSYREWEMGKN
jgi:hypothetical protein